MKMKWILSSQSNAILHELNQEKGTQVIDNKKYRRHRTAEV